MIIKIPPNLNPQENKCFNEIVKPQLEELYSCEYNKLEFKQVNIFISKKIKNISKKQIKQILSKIPKKDLDFVSDIYFVSYKCKDETENHLVYGRTLPIVYKILIYPKVKDRLKIILVHEIGHVIFEKGLSNELKLLFASELTKTFIQTAFWSQEERNKFIREEFANCYEVFINNPDRLRRFPYLYNFFKKIYD